MKVYEKIIGAVIKFEKIHSFLKDDCIVAFSGGLDSQVLLDVIKRYKSDMKIKARTIACHVPVFAEGIKRLESTGVVELEINDSIKFPVNCSLCSRIRKRALLEYAEKSNITNILLGHNKSDFVENFLYNQIYHKRFESMPLKRTYFGKYNFLRPFAFCDRKYIETYARKNNLYDIENKCTFQSNLRSSFRETIDKLNKNYNLYNNIMDLIEENNFYGESNE